MTGASEVFSESLSVQVLDVPSAFRQVQKEGGSKLIRYLIWASKGTWLFLLFVLSLTCFYAGTFFSKYSHLPDYSWLSFLAALVFTVWIVFFALASGAFDRNIRTDFFKIFRRLVFSWLCAVVFMVSSFVFITYETIGRLSVFFGSGMVLLAISFCVFFLIKKFKSNPYLVCLIGKESPLTRLIKDGVLAGRNSFYLQVDFPNENSSSKEIEEALAQFQKLGARDLVFTDEVLLKKQNTLYSRMGIHAVKTGFYLRNEISYYSRVFERYPLEHMNAKDVFSLELATLNPFNSVGKRLFDIIASLIALICFSPLILFLALVVKIDSKGPAVFAQKRKGRGGKEFTVYKFRSMKWVNSEVDKTFEDARRGAEEVRITSVGRWMRALHLDELPQLWNIFVGDMSFVGPRPETVEISEKITEYQPFFDMRTILRPGLTGLAQLSQGKTLYGADEITTKLSYDLYYIKHFSLGLDLWLLTRTFFLLTKKTW